MKRVSVDIPISNLPDALASIELAFKHYQPIKATLRMKKLKSEPFIRFTGWLAKTNGKE